MEFITGDMGIAVEGASVNCRTLQIGKTEMKALVYLFPRDGRVTYIHWPCAGVFLPVTTRHLLLVEDAAMTDSVIQLTRVWSNW